MGAALTGSMASGGGTAPAGATVPDVPPSAPLATTWITSRGSWALVPMGRLLHPHTVFWQMFFRADGAKAWSLVTPTGVADNGGLVAGQTSSGTLTAGFEPSQYLDYSPLAQTASAGRRWLPGILPAALLAVPDALATEPGGGVLALVRSANGSLLSSKGNLSSWRTTARLGAVAGTGPGRACGLVALRAVTVNDGTQVLGGACTRPGQVGVFTRSGGSWVLGGPRLPGAAGSQPTSVLRLAVGPGGTSGLVAAGHGSATTLFAMWRAGLSAPWSLSPPLHPVGRLLATGFGPSDGLVVVTEGAGGVRRADSVAGPHAYWLSLPRLPGGTAAVAAGPGGAFDALAVHGSDLFDWGFDPARDAWRRTRTLVVPIQYGSST
jgi:hypothetical protein